MFPNVEKRVVRSVARNLDPTPNQKGVEHIHQHLKALADGLAMHTTEAGPPLMLELDEYQLDSMRAALEYWLRDNASSLPDTECMRSVLAAVKAIIGERDAPGAA